MKIEELKELLLFLDKWSRHNKDKIKHPNRAKHFLQDMSYVIHWLDDKRVNPTIQRWRHESAPKTICKLFGIKSAELTNKEKNEN